MMILEFKSGNKIKVNQQIAAIIAQRINSPDGAKAWQAFAPSQDMSDTNLLINLSEVAGIYSNENII